MPIFDLGNAVAVVPMHSPATYSADRNGNAVDTANFAYALIVINAGNIVSPENVTFIIEQAETSSGTWESCTLLNSTTPASLRITDAGDDSCVFIRMDLNNTKRYIRARADHSASAGHTYGVTMVLLPYQTDATTSDTGAASAPNISI